MGMFIPDNHRQRVTIEKIDTVPVHDLEITDNGLGRAYNYVHLPEKETNEHFVTELEEK